MSFCWDCVRIILTLERKCEQSGYVLAMCSFAISCCLQLLYKSKVSRFKEIHCKRICLFGSKEHATTALRWANHTMNCKQSFFRKSKFVRPITVLCLYCTLQCLSFSGLQEIGVTDLHKATTVCISAMCISPCSVHVATSYSSVSKSQ